MKQTLQLKLGQQLTMTPQLQQAIRLLQLSTLELQTEIQEALDSNPMLEVAEDTAGEDNPDARLTEVTPGEVESKAVDNTSQDIPQELSVDSSWEDTFDIPISSNRASDDDNRDYDHNASSEQSLHEYLTWQMQLTPFSDTDRTIATALLDAIDDDGYLSESIEAIYQGLENELGIEVDEVEAVLRQIQNFDPPGVAARDLRESMLLQLQRLDANDPHRLAALSIINQHFELLANRDYANLMRRTKLGEADLQQTVQLIQSLNPRPGNQISTSKTEYIVPDVVVRKVKNRWRAELNLEMTPRLGINRLYAELAQRHNGSDVNYLRNQLQEARWFIKSLKSRNETLLKVAQCIVDQQRGFFDFGEEAMQPLVMADIAQAVGMHESTISRVTTKKYMHSPRGIFELKYFFSSHVSTTGGGEASATAIRAIIKKLISAEKPTKPLSDSKLASLLEEQGIQVARRTVAKYRETMGIAPSNERKRLI